MRTSRIDLNGSWIKKGDRVSLLTDCNSWFQAIATLRVGHLNRLAALGFFRHGPKLRKPAETVGFLTDRPGRLCQGAGGPPFAAGVLPQALDDLV